MFLLQNQKESERYKVTLPDGSVTTVLAGCGQTISEMLSPLAAQLQPGLDFYDVVLADSKVVSLSK